MDFFAEQDRARKLTRWLVFWYLTILFAISVLSTLVLMLLVPFFTHDFVLSYDLYRFDNWSIFLGASGFVFSGAFLSSWLKNRQFANGGRAVAEALGGKFVTRNTSDFLKNRALNIVQEMAIAANLPVPQLFILEKEQNINAFAAGLYSDDAVIALTQGALEKLNRQQLQGVVAHEFSHILNGDMRLNMRLVMLLHGIEFVGVLGRFLTPRRTMRRSGKKSGGGLFILVAILLRMIGWIGELFAKLLQAAVCRQREYLADASAVQFTRNPNGIAEVLKILLHPSVEVNTADFRQNDGVSSKIVDSDAQEYAHLFFAKAISSRFEWFATHPPLQERILRIDPYWDGSTISAEVFSDSEKHPAETVLAKELPAGKIFASIETLQDMALLLPLVMNRLPEERDAKDSLAQASVMQLIESVKQPLDAMAVVLAIQFYRQFSESKRQQMLADPSFNTQFLALLSAEGRAVFGHFIGLDSLMIGALKHLEQVPNVNRLILIEMAIPSLKEMSSRQFKDFNYLLDDVIKIDGQVSIYEHTLKALLIRSLQRHFTGDSNAHRTATIRSWKVVDLELRLLLSYFIHHYLTDDATHSYAQQKFNDYCQMLEIEKSPILSVEGVNEAAFEGVLHKLQRLVYEKKRILLQVLVFIVEEDGILTVAEQELLLAVALSLDAPFPRFSR